MFICLYIYMFLQFVCVCLCWSAQLSNFCPLYKSAATALLPFIHLFFIFKVKIIVLFSLFLFLCCCCFNTKNLTLIVSGCLSASDYFFVVFPLNLHHISTHIHIVSSTAQLDRYIYTSICTNT